LDGTPPPPELATLHDGDWHAVAAVAADAPARLAVSESEIEP